MDLRYKILLELKARELETREFVANEYLSKLPYDLGTIKRALIELRNSNYIQESNVPPNKSVIDEIVAIDNEGPEKLLNKTHGAIRLVLTLDGTRFLLEDSKLKVDYAISRWTKFLFWPVAAFSVISLALSLINFF